MKMYEVPDYELLMLSVMDVITASEEESGQGSGSGSGSGSGWELPPIPLK